MSVDVIVGLQYGSEGKGKLAGLLAHEYQHAVRVGAPNAGHTVIHGGKAYKMRQVPCAWVNPECLLYIGAGGMVNMDVLHDELLTLPEGVINRLYIDENAHILTPADIIHEEEGSFNAFNGSTAEGVGHCQARKVLRKHGTIAGRANLPGQTVIDTKRKLWAALEEGDDIMIEGTQGYGLSLDHGSYPYVTSRNVLAASMLSDVGFSPHSCRHVLGVLRTYPIRVAGNSGPMHMEEISWDLVAQRSGYKFIEERTTVTNRVRRVSEFSWKMAEEACRANEPDGIFITFIDYLDSKLRGKTSLQDLYDSERARQFIEQVTDRLGPVMAVSTGPAPEETIYMTQWYELFKSTIKEVAP